MGSGLDLPPALSDWLTAHAASLDADSVHSEDVLPALAAAGLTGAGIPSAFGGTGGDTRDGVAAIAAVARHSLTAAFLFWSHRAFSECVLQAPHAELRERLLPELVSGQRAGAVGLSNAMKFIAGLEPLQLRATPSPDGCRIDGHLPWVTNLDPRGFVAAIAVDGGGLASSPIVAMPSDRAGLARGDDLDLVALRGSRTGTLTLEAVAMKRTDIVAPDAAEYLPRVRPAFLSLQCGLAIGLAEAALRAARDAGGVLRQPLADARAALARARDELDAGLADGLFERAIASLFALRIRLADLAQQAVQLELMATSGRAYLRDPSNAFPRRWREAAFLPIITPTLVQLRGALQTMKVPA